MKSIFLAIAFLLVSTLANAEIVGSLDGVNLTTIWGWSADAANGSQIVTVSIYSDGALIASGPTTVLRQDVNSAWKISGNHGFSFAVPASLADGKNHSINAKVGNVTLWGSPISANFGGTPPQPPSGNAPVSGSITLPKTAVWCDAQKVCTTIPLTVTQ